MPIPSPAADPAPVQTSWLHALEPGRQITGHARVIAAERALARTGVPFHRLTLGDASGTTITARRFNTGDEAVPPVGAVVSVTGLVERYREQACLTLRRCVVDPAIPASVFVPAMPPSRRATLADLDAEIALITDAALRDWVTACYSASCRAAFAAHPAAVRHHGAAAGGLLTHTVRVARIARGLVELLPGIDRDEVLAGALLHDLGKLRELGAEPGSDLTDDGLLLGHLVLGVRLAWAAAAGIARLAPARVDRVLHIVLASHGTPAWGSPVPPATLEAVTVHLADLAEARLEQALRARETAPAGAGRTAFVPGLGSRFLVE